MNNGFVAGSTLKAMWLWHPELSEIDAWFETKTKEFAEKENRKPNRDSEAWLQKYIYTDRRSPSILRYLSSRVAFVECEASRLQ